MEKSKWIQQWWMELLSVFCMFLSIVAIVLTLSLHQGRLLPAWPFAITINALLALYTAVFKGSMLLVVAAVLGQLKWFWYRTVRPLYDLEVFDQASRGPMGALELIWTFRKQLKAALLPTIGAVLTIVAILVDPFAQQIVEYYSCPSSSTTASKARIPRINTYINPQEAPYSLYLDQPTAGAFYSGTFDPLGSKRINPFYCETGHCNFDAYWSLGFCSQCEDISNQISEKLPRHRHAHEIETQYCLSAGLNLAWNRPLPDTPAGRLGSDEIVDTLLSATTVTNLSHLNTTSTLHIRMIAGQPHSLPHRKVMHWSSESPSLGAASCHLYPCVQQFEASVRSGILNETQIQSFRLPIYSPVIALAYGDPVPYTSGNSVSALTSCLNETEVAFLAAKGCDINAPLVDLLRLEGTDDLQRLNPSCLYGYPRSMWTLLGTYALKYFSGSVGVLSKNWRSILNGPQAMQAFYDNGGVNYEAVRQKIQSIAEALTNHMRLNDASDSVPAYGVSIEATTCAGVRWGWITLPLVLLLLTLALLFYAMKESKEAQASSWKTSALALLFHGLDSNTRSIHCNLAPTREMERASQLLHVKMELTDEGWIFAQKEDVNKPMSQLEPSSASRSELQVNGPLEDDPLQNEPFGNERAENGAQAQEFEDERLCNRESGRLEAS